MQNTRLIMEAQMAIGNEASVQGGLAVTRLGFDPSKLSAKSNRQTKASIRSRKKMKGKPTLGETTKKKYLLIHLAYQEIFSTMSNCRY